MDGPARSGVNPVSMRLAWRGVHLGCVSGLPLLPARLWVGNPSLVARRWRGFINLAMPLILIDTTFWADALTYVLPAPIRRINSGSSTPGWQCMFGPSPYIGVLSPEQRPWRRSCHHRSVVGVHPRIGWRAAFSTRCHLFGCDSGLSAMRLWPTSVWRAHRIWWWMILAPIFLGEPRLCTQKMVVRARTWRGLHQPGVGCHPPRCATSSLPGSSHSVLLIVCLGLCRW